MANRPLKANLRKGSVFSFDLPLEVANEKPEVLPPAKPLLKKVLIVDDNATNRFLMGEIFSYFGIAFETSPNGPLALREIEDAIANKEPFRPGDPARPSHARYGWHHPDQRDQEKHAFA